MLVLRQTFPFPVYCNLQNFYLGEFFYDFNELHLTCKILNIIKMSEEIFYCKGITVLFLGIPDKNDNKQIIQLYSGPYSEPCQTSKMEA